MSNEPNPPEPASPNPLSEALSGSLSGALGRIPSGLFVVATRLAGRDIGFVGSFVQQVGFAPPTVMVAIANGREYLAGTRESGRFTVSVLGEGDRGLMRPFFKASAGGSALEQVATSTTATGGIVLADALAWVDCRVSAEHAVGDHVVVFGVVEGGARLRDGAPLVHVRRNGLGY
jgi:flavin reductase (DIM6/NTAB) family NADH-FMN oxidoreductase RutF